MQYCGLNVEDIPPVEGWAMHTGSGSRSLAWWIGSGWNGWVLAGLGCLGFFGVSAGLAWAAWTAAHGLLACWPGWLSPTWM